MDLVRWALSTLFPVTSRSTTLLIPHGRRFQFRSHRFLGIFFLLWLFYFGYNNCGGISTGIESSVPDGCVITSDRLCDLSGYRFDCDGFLGNGATDGTGRIACHNLIDAAWSSFAYLMTFSWHRLGIRTPIDVLSIGNAIGWNGLTGNGSVDQN